MCSESDQGVKFLEKGKEPWMSIRRAISSTFKSLELWARRPIRSDDCFLQSGYHAFGNSVLPRQWPKVCAGKKIFEEAVEKNKHDENLLEEALFNLMNDETNHGVDESMRQQTGNCSTSFECWYLISMWNLAIRLWWINTNDSVSWFPQMNLKICLTWEAPWSFTSKNGTMGREPTPWYSYEETVAPHMSRKL